MNDKIRLLVVDDSAVARKVVSDIISSADDIEIIGRVRNGREAVERLTKYRADVITMDFEMPEMDGLTAVKKILEQQPIPIVMLSAYTQRGAELTFKALDAGAVDFIPKPTNADDVKSKEFAETLKTKIRLAYSAKVKLRKTFTQPIYKKPPIVLPAHTGKPARSLVVIGISTGGPSALKTMLMAIRSDFPAGICIVQHMPKGFTAAFSERMNEVSALSVKEAADGDPIVSGHVYIAPGQQQMAVKMKDGMPYIRVWEGKKVSGHAPSADVLMMSAVRNFTGSLVGIIMTGMGHDGARGIRELHANGCYTIAQDEETSVVFGMNRTAIEEGSISKVLPLESIVPAIEQRRELLLR